MFVVIGSVPMLAVDMDRCVMLHPQCSPLIDMPCCQSHAPDRNDRTTPAARLLAPAPDAAVACVPALTGLPPSGSVLVAIRFQPPRGHVSGDLLTRLSLLLI